jgi:uncharacterized protein (TIGR02271 family)
MPVANDKLSWRGQELTDKSGDKLGRIEEIYLDADTDQPEWALVHTGLFGTKQTFVPIREASASGDTISVPFEKSLIKDAPKVDADGRLSQEEESALYRHYGMNYSESRSDSGLPDGGGRTERTETTGRGVVGNDTSGPETDEAMTRSEEELRVGTTQRETGRARLRKHIVSDTVTETVPVSREEVRIEREPITDANVGNATDGPALSEEEHEVTLRAEEPVVEKRVVPKERIRMDKETFTEEKQVSEEVRREEIDIDGDTGRGDLDRDRR